MDNGSHQGVVVDQQPIGYDDVNHATYRRYSYTNSIYLLVNYGRQN